MRIAALPILAALALGSCGLLRSRPPQYPPYVTVTGLGVRDLVVPAGDVVSAGHTVLVHYEGRLENGEIFDSSYELGRPIRFDVGAGDVPPGIDEGVVGMARGGRRLLTVPPELGYGAEGVEGRVPPGATLEIEIEVLEIDPGS